jgi:hypothetical protein
VRNVSWRISDHTLRAVMAFSRGMGEGHVLRREDRQNGGLLGGNGVTEGVRQHPFPVADTQVITVRRDRAAVSA